MVYRRTERVEARLKDNRRRILDAARALVAEHGFRETPIALVASLAYVAVGSDPRAALDEGAHHVLRYYGQLWTEPGNLIHHGPASKIAEEVAAYEDAVDVLVLFPQIPRLDQVEQLAEHVLPAYRTEAVAAH